MAESLDPALLRQIQAQLGEALRGRPEVIDLALITLLAHGHLLIEDVPGVGKTTLALALADVFGLSFSRVQMTSDLLPSDLTGVNIYNPDLRKFEFQQGPLFENVVMADELNRTPPKTQSALLEAMEEGHVSVDGTSHKLPDMFFVIATQNPVEQSGTFELPESQLDRFMARLSIGYPPAEVEVELVQGGRFRLRDSQVKQLASPEDLSHWRAQVREIKVTEDVARYIARLVRATRARDDVRLGVSPRGLLALGIAARARAYMDHRDYVLPDDVKGLAVHVLSHRIAPRALTTGQRADEQLAIMRDIVETTAVPG